jgi:hypothetical protein
MSPLIFLLVMFVGFGIFGLVSERESRTRRRAELRRTIEEPIAALPRRKRGPW